MVSCSTSLWYRSPFSGLLWPSAFLFPYLLGHLFTERRRFIVICLSSLPSTITRTVPCLNYIDCCILILYIIQIVCKSSSSLGCTRIIPPLRPQERPCLHHLTSSARFFQLNAPDTRHDQRQDGINQDRRLSSRFIHSGTSEKGARHSLRKASWRSGLSRMSSRQGPMSTLKRIRQLSKMPAIQL